MNDWYIADLHIGHRHVAETRGFDDPADHDRKLAELWDEKVATGDRGVGARRHLRRRKRQELNALLWLADRPGEKHLVTSNHDGCHPMRSLAAKWQSIYLANGFASVQQTAVHKIAGQRVILTHFPFRHDPEGDHTPENRFESWRVPDDGQIIIHGHTHSKVQVRGPQIHVGADAHGLASVSRAWVTEQVERIVAATAT
ncbi:hypothetical protein [Nocardia abscessus]|uniref:hypothetical protein n=1 Tax=Nocardia abscessus TaxID=120957 RepID=UPI001E602D7B|nr:hypothetical protein [Nocardia abscessus]